MDVVQILRSMADSLDVRLRIASHNVQGINSPIKRRKLMDHYKSLHLDIVMLQETHFPVRYSPTFIHSYFPQFYLASAENKTKGVAILISKKCTFVKISDTVDPEGRFILVKGKIGDQLFSLVSYYAPNRGQAKFFKSLLDTLSPELEGTIVFGGDSNTALDQGLDKSKPPGSRVLRPTKESLKIAKILHEFGLADTWRELNPSKRDYTHFSHPHLTYARIDHILIPSTSLPTVLSASIRDSALSDHSLVIISLALGLPEGSRLFWRLNESLLSDPVRVAEIEKALTEYFLDNDNDSVPPATLWAAHKSMMTGKLIQIASKLKRERRADT